MQPFISVTPEEVGISSLDLLALLESYVTGDLTEMKGCITASFC